MWLVGIAILLVQGLAFVLSVRASEAPDPEYRRALRSGFRLITVAQVVNVGTVAWFARHTRRFGFGVSAISLGVALMTLAVALRLRRHGRGQRASRIERRIVLRKICHETATPLAAISGYAQMADDARIRAATRQSLLRKIHRISVRLAEVVRDLLEVTQRDGALPIEFGDVAVDALIADQLLLLGPEAERRGLELRAHVGAGVPGRVQGDRRLLRLALQHLLRNAIENSERGSVTLTVEALPAVGGRYALRYTITDQGRGIAAETLRRFRGETDSASWPVGGLARGLGIGLPLCHKIAVALEGRFRIDSERGCGTQVVFEVPYWTHGRRRRADAGAAADSAVDADASLREGRFDVDRWLAAQAGADTSPVLAGRRILLVEDGPENREYIRHFLQRAGADVDTAAHGRDALEVLALGPDRYDLVLMDMDMPVMDGYAATAAARARGYEMPIVALSAHSLIEDQRKSLDAGCDEFLAKPIAAGTLVDACARHRPCRGRRAVDEVQWTRRAATPPALEPVRSKWADDPAFRELLDEYHRVMPNILAELEAAHRAGGVESVRTLAHRLKGSGGQYGYEELHRAAARCESLLKQGRCLDEVAVEFRDLVLEIRRVAQNA